MRALRDTESAEGVGEHVWVVPEGYLPPDSTGPEPQVTSHETVCILNRGNDAASVEITIYFADRDPLGPFRVEVPGLRTAHIRLNDLEDPEPIPRDTDYASVIRSDRAIVVQHTRLDSRQAENALLSTIAFPVPDR